MNKKGMAVELLLFVMIGIFLAIFLAGWIYAVDLVNTNLINIPTNNNINVSQATQGTFSYLNNASDEIAFLPVFFMVAYMLGIFAYCYYSPKSPVWFLFYFMFNILVIILSIYVSNAYESILSTKVIGETLAQFSTTNMIMSYLPVWTTFIGFIGLLIMVSSYYREGGAI